MCGEDIGAIDLLYFQIASPPPPPCLGLTHLARLASKQDPVILLPQFPWCRVYKCIALYSTLVLGL